MNEREKMLLNLSSTTPDVIDVIVEEKKMPLQASDIEDITSKSKSIKLSTLDYQILVTLSNGFKTEEAIAEDYQVSRNYIKKLMRSEDGSEFLQEQAKQKSDAALALTTNMVHNGMQIYQEYIADLLSKNKTAEALYHLFGKQSVVDVQNILHKQQVGVIEDDSKGLIQLFQNISVGK